MSDIWQSDFPESLTAGTTNIIVSYTYGGVTESVIIDGLSVAVPDFITLNIVIFDYATSNGWSSGTKYLSIVSGPITLTANGGTNTGKYYSSNNSWRFYSGETAKLTISGDNTVASIDSVSITPTWDFTLHGNVANSSSLSSNREITSITITYTLADSQGEASDFNDWIMAFSGGDITTPDCESNFMEAFLLWDEMSEAAKTLIKTDAQFADAFARYSAWALANGQTVDGENISPINWATNVGKDSKIGAIISISLIGLTAIVGYYLFGKKKQLV